MKTNELRKFWLIYLKSSYYDNIPYSRHNNDNSSYQLYAYTDNKDTLISFFNIRNKDIFKIKKTHLDQSEFNLLFKEYPSSFIRIHKAIMLNGDYNKKEISVEMTDNEFNSCFNYGLGIIGSDIWTCAFDSFEIYSNHTLKILSRLNYIAVNRSLEEGECEFADWLEPNIIPIFIYLYKPILDINRKK